MAAEKRLIWRETLEQCLARRFKRKLFLTPESGRLVINPAKDGLTEQQRAEFDVGSTMHPLMDAVHFAFSQHYPLTLSPDAIWVVIAQGFSHHVQENAESLRSRLVRHQAKAALTAEGVALLTPGSLAGAIASLSAQIREASDPVLHESLVCDFSTTTPGIRTASEVVLLDTYSSYFEYYMRCVCGIPRITLTGTAEDWHRIRARVEVLATYELGWWVDRLQPILDEFVQTAEGSPNREFWQSIYKPRHVYGATLATGWIADLFPYLNDPPRRKKNSVLQYERKGWAVEREEAIPTFSFPGYEGSGTGPSIDSFPSGLSSVPITLTYPDESATKVDLVGGYLAVEQNEADCSISPVIGWCMTERAPAEPIRI